MLDLQDIQRDMDRLRSAQDVLQAVIRSTGATGAVVFELNGEPVVEAGGLEGAVAGLAKRLALLWKGSGDVAAMFGGNSFEEQAFLGTGYHVHVARCGLEHLLAIAYTNESNLGLVRLYALPSADRMGVLLAEAIEDSQSESE